LERKRKGNEAYIERIQVWKYKRSCKYSL